MPLPPRYEAMPPPPPGPRVVWQRGGWDWTGSGYVWSAGYHVVRGAASRCLDTGPGYRAWIPGHWARRG